MAQFEVFRTSAGDLVLDCQSDVLWRYNTRIAVPLRPLDEALPTMKHLNPVFQVLGSPLVMYPEFMAAVPMRELRDRVSSLAGHYLEVQTAIDFLISGS